MCDLSSTYFRYLPKDLENLLIEKLKRPEITICPDPNYELQGRFSPLITIKFGIGVTFPIPISYIWKDAIKRIQVFREGTINNKNFILKFSASGSTYGTVLEVSNREHPKYQIFSNTSYRRITEVDLLNKENMILLVDKILEYIKVISDTNIDRSSFFK